MIDSLVTYDLEDIEKKFALTKIKSWYKGGLINEEQWAKVQDSFSSGLYSPTVIMRVLLFIATYFGLSSVLGPLFMIFEGIGEVAIRIIVVISGVAMLAFTDRVLIKNKNHFKSGVTEASSYAGISFVYFGILGFDIDEPLIYLSVALVILIGFSIRYLDLISLVCSIGCFIAMLFVLLEDFMALLPFIIMVVFTLLYLASQSIQKKARQLIWEDHFIVFDTLALLLIYLSGNYFVVRELSVEMMNLNLSDGQDIPFAYLFYAFTLLLPIFYLTWGILKKSILFIRVSLLVLTLSVVTLKYYYIHVNTEVVITFAGAFLLLISLALIKYLKISRKGFIREQIFQGKWDNADLTAFIASQTLGGNQVDNTNTTITGQGGQFGGGGASGDF
jgi:hypothetical protein